MSKITYWHCTDCGNLLVKFSRRENKVVVTIMCPLCGESVDFHQDHILSALEDDGLPTERFIHDCPPGVY